MMATCLDLLRELRVHRRATIRALGSLPDDKLTISLGAPGAGDVRAAILSLAQDDDRRCVDLGEIFGDVGWRPAEAQRILASLALTRGQLRARLVGVTDQVLDQVPEPGEWAVRQALQHIVNNERRFVADVAYAIERFHNQPSLPVERPGEARGPGTLGAGLPGGIEEVLHTLENVRDELAGAVSGLGREELGAATPWGQREVEIRFMLHRRATHEREHTVQISKVLQAVSPRLTEVQMLLASAEVARGILEGMVVGITDELPDHVSGGWLDAIKQTLRDATANESANVEAIRVAIS
jgi:hypothetical protein